MKDNRLPEKLDDSQMNSYFSTIFNSNCTSEDFIDFSGLKWDLPVIVVSEKEPFYKRENILDGVLGIYFHENKWKSEGRIILYHKNIRRASDEIASNPKFKITEEFAYISLLKIVLLHELGHWIHHWKLPVNTISKTEKEYYNNNFKDQSKELKEAIAQYFVWLAIHEDIPLLKVFIALLADQNPIYHGHKELIKQAEIGKRIIETYIINYKLLKNVLTEEDILKVEELKPAEKQDQLIGIIEDNIKSFKNEQLNPLDFLKPFISNDKWDNLIVLRGLLNLAF